MNSVFSKYPRLIGSSQVTDRINEIYRHLRRQQVQPGAGTQIRQGTNGFTIEAKPARRGPRSGGAAWL